VDTVWSETIERARRLDDELVRQRVDGEWSFVETLRHLIFVSDAWLGRTIMSEAEPYHRLGIPPDHGIGEPDPAVDVGPWGIDVFAEADLDDVVAVRDERTRQMRALVADLSDGDLRSLCANNTAPGFPASTRIPVQVAIDVVIGEEWAHHGFAHRDLTKLLTRDG